MVHLYLQYLVQKDRVELEKGNKDDQSQTSLS